MSRRDVPGRALMFMPVSRSVPHSIIRALLGSPRVWLVLILLLAWGLRLYHLDTMSLWWDESLSWDRALNTIPNILSNTIVIQNVATRDLHPPLYFLLLHVSVLVAGATEFALRFFSAFANELTLALLFPLTVRLVKNKFVALLAVLFAAVSPFYVWYSQEARPYALVLLWSALAVYALLRWLDTKPRAWRALTSRWFIGFGIAFLLTLTTHYLSFVLLPFFAATLLLYDTAAPTWRARLASPLTALAILLCGGFAAILVLLPRGAQDLASWDQVGATFVPFFIMLRDVWNSFAVGVTANLDTVAWLDLYLLALWCVGVFSTVRVKTRTVRLALFLVCYLFLPAVVLQLGSYLRPLYLNSRHLITTSPAFYIGLAIGVHALAHKIANIRPQTADGGRTTNRAPRVVRHPSSVVIATIVATVLILPILGGALYSLNNLYYDTAYAKDNHKAWSQFLRERLRPDDYLLLVAPQAEKIVAYYAPEGLRWESLPHLAQTQDWQIFLDRESVLNAYRKHGRVWFLEIHQPVGDPKFAINQLLHKYGAPVDIVYFPAIASRIILQQFVYRGAAQPDDIALPNPVEIQYSNRLKLKGYDAPRQMEPGTRAAVKLYWRLSGKSPTDISVSLRVVDDAGKVWGQWDAPPIGNLFPVSKWAGRTIYLDQHDLVVDPGAPPGEYKIEMQVYRAAGHEPLTANLPDNTTREVLELGTLQVTRPTTPRDPTTLIVDQHTNVDFGAVVRLVGYDVEPNAAPGTAIPLALYFQVTRNPEQNLTGSVTLTAPWWQVWNRARAVTPFTLDLTNRQVGDIVQANVGARVPGDANAGAYELKLALDDYAPQTFLNFANELNLATVAVQALTRSTNMPAIQNTVNARLGEQVEFLGYDLDAPENLKPGDTVQMILYWRALQPMDTPYKVFTHLINAQNEIFGQQDKEPLDGARPTTSWAAGEIFTDRYEFQVAPNVTPGKYQIEIGMYHPTDFTRLPTFDVNGNALGDRILFGELRVP